MSVGAHENRGHQQASYADQTLMLSSLQGVLNTDIKNQMKTNVAIKRYQPITSVERSLNKELLDKVRYNFVLSVKRVYAEMIVLLFLSCLPFTVLFVKARFAAALYLVLRVCAEMIVLLFNL
jgi:hypothetical protein